MKYIKFLFIFWSGVVLAQTPVEFSDYFTNQTLRVDYFHTGDTKSEFFALDKVYKSNGLAGNPNSCIQPYELGLYRVVLKDTLSGKTIFTRGFSSIYAEYQTIGEAQAGIKKTFFETLLVPCPKMPIKFIIEKRDKQNVPHEVYSRIIDPADYHLNTETQHRKTDIIVTVLKNGEPQNHVDLVILGEGYTSKEKALFEKDLKYFTNVLFQFEPYKSHKTLFNINGLFSPSEESGTDEPRQDIYKNTRFNTTFNFFDVDRYCLTEDIKSIHDVAGNVPYDAVLIMVNRNRYGGGGIYNFYTLFNTGSDKRDYVFIHEFGHAFAGLADEYYTSTVAYEDIFVPGVEPLDPNITALLNTANVKWKQYLTPGLKIPTEWGKAYFDSLSFKQNEIRDEKIHTLTKLKLSGISDIEYQKKEAEFDAKIREYAILIDNFIFNHPLKNKVGVFEGANYTSKGYYRPTVNSMMHRFDPSDPTFGVVNEAAIMRVIDYFTK